MARLSTAHVTGWIDNKKKDSINASSFIACPSIYMRETHHSCIVFKRCSGVSSVSAYFPKGTFPSRCLFNKTSRIVVLSILNVSFNRVKCNPELSPALDKQKQPASSGKTRMWQIYFELRTFVEDYFRLQVEIVWWCIVYRFRILYAVCDRECNCVSAKTVVLL